MNIEEKYERAKFVLEKIANWDPDFHYMNGEESFNCCQNMAKTFLRNIDNQISKEGNIIKTERFTKK